MNRWDEIKTKNLEGYTYEWINLSPTSASEKEGVRQAAERIQDILLYVREFWKNSHGIMDKKKGFFNGDDVVIYKSESELRNKLQYINSMLSLSRAYIEFGQTNKKIDHEIICVILHIFSNYNWGEEQLNREYWIAEFFNTIASNFTQPSTPRDLRKLLYTIYDNSLSILELIGTLQLNYILVSSLKNFRTSQENPSPSRYSDEMDLKRFFRELFDANGFNIPTNLGLFEEGNVSDSIKSNTAPKQDNLMADFMIHQVVEADQAAKLPGCIYLLNFLFGIADRDKELGNKLTATLKNILLQREALFNQLMKIELIADEKDYEILQELSPTPKQIVDLEQFTHDVDKLLLDNVLLNGGYKIDANAHKNRTREIIKVLNTLNAKFRERKNQPRLFSKMQNIIRILEVPKKISELIAAGPKDKDKDCAELFQVAIKFLAYTTYKNGTSQQELLPSVYTFLSLIPKNIDVTKLIANLYSQIKQTSECSELIKYIFEILNGYEELEQIEPYHCQYLVILRTLIFDHYRNPINDNQRKIMANLMKNHLFNKAVSGVIEPKINESKDAAERRGEKMKSEKVTQIKFRVDFFVLFANLAYESKIGVLQAKKILGYDQFKHCLMEPTTPFLLKKPYLRSLFHVYISNFDKLNDDFELKNLIELFNSVVIPDLQLYRRYLEGLADLKVENGEKKRKAQEDRIKLQNFKVHRVPESEKKEEKSSIKSQDPRLAQLTDNKRIVEDSSEYWDYLCSGKSWDLRRDGLLYFIIDCFQEINSNRGWIMDETLSGVLANIREVLQQISKVLSEIEATYNMNFNKFNVLITECINSFPSKKVIKIGKTYHARSDGVRVDVDEDVSPLHDLEEPDNSPSKAVAHDPVSVMIRKIKAVVIKKKLSIKDFFNLFGEFDDEIPTPQFKIIIKEFLKSNVEHQVDGFAEILQLQNGKDAKFIVLSKQVFRKLKNEMQNEDKPKFLGMIKENMEIKLGGSSKPELSQINKKLQEYLKTIAPYCLEVKENTEIEDFVEKIHEKIEHYIEQKQELEIKMLISKMRDAFSSPKYKVLFLTIISFLLAKYDYTIKRRKGVDEATFEKSVESADRKLKKIQTLLDSAEITELCIKLYVQETDLVLLENATDVLIASLHRGNRAVQTAILERLKEGNLRFSFFNFIKDQLYQYITNYMYIKTQNERYVGVRWNKIKIPGQPESMIADELRQLEITRKLLQLVQLFCENVYTDFQNFLRDQDTGEGKSSQVSINLISEIAVFLVTLQQADEKVLSNPDAIRIISQTLQTLADTCLGPCEMNQAELGEKKHLLEFISTIANLEISFECGEDDDDDDEESKRSLKGLQTDLFSDVIQFLLAIFEENPNREVKKKILSNLSLDNLKKQFLKIYQDQVQKKDIQTYYQERLSPNEFNILQTGFDIHIFFTLVKEEFGQEQAFANVYSIKKLSRNEVAQLAKFSKKFKDKDNEDGEKLVKMNSLTRKMNKIHPGYRNVGDDSLASPLHPHPQEPAIGVGSPADNKSPADGKTSEIKYRKDNSPWEDLDSGKGKVSQSLLKHDKTNDASPIQERLIKPIARSKMKKGTALVELVNPEEQKRQEEEKEEYNQYKELKARKLLNEAIEFFKTYVQSVEILNEDEEPKKQYFQIPFVCNFVTSNIEHHLIYQAPRDSDNERVEHLVMNVDRYLKEMEHRQKIARFSMLSWFTKNWRFLKDIAFLFVIACNIVILIVFIRDPEAETPIDVAFDTADIPQWADITFAILSIIQSIVAVISLFFCALERFPISVYRSRKQMLSSKALSLEYKNDLAIERNTTDLVKRIKNIFAEYQEARALEAEKNKTVPGFGTKFWRICTDLENFYNLVYVLFSLLATCLHPLFYAALLLDIIKTSEDLRNIIRSVTLNLTQLFKTCVLGGIVMYFYAILGYLYFEENFTSENGLYCDSLFHCFTSIINVGLRNGGGVGDAMDPVEMDGDPKYWGKYFYDFTFFIFCIIILLNIVFGIIIDTFAELRDQKKERENNVRGKCFICGLDKYEFDTKGNGWEIHVYAEHNVYAYLNYLIYIQKKNINDCNAIEKRVKELLKAKSIEFMPIQKSAVLEAADKDDD